MGERGWHAARLALKWPNRLVRCYRFCCARAMGEWSPPINQQEEIGMEATGEAPSAQTTPSQVSHRAVPPALTAWCLDRSGAHGVELHVPRRGQEVVFIHDERERSGLATDALAWKTNCQRALIVNTRSAKDNRGHGIKGETHGEVRYAIESPPPMVQVSGSCSGSDGERSCFGRREGTGQKVYDRSDQSSICRTTRVSVPRILPRPSFGKRRVSRIYSRAAELEADRPSGIYQRTKTR